jgi:very-short-patch-repair endonuclease
VAHRVRAGRLHRIHRGVYAVGHPGLSNEGRWMAAVLACGEGAVLSHRSAAELWGLLKVGNGPIDVTVPGAAGRKHHRGIRLHRSPSVLSASTIHNAIAVTTPARTIADLRRTATKDDLGRAIREAEFQGLSIGAQPDQDRTASRFERRFFTFCRRHRLPLPEVNFAIGPYTVDFLWPEAQLIVEVDGWETHGTRSAFEADRARDAWLTSQGYRVIRFTWRQVKSEGPEVAQVVRTILGM